MEWGKDRVRKQVLQKMLGCVNRGSLDECFEDTWETGSQGFEIERKKREY